MALKFSKYSFIAGVNCLKSIYLHYKNPELKSSLSEQQNLAFSKAALVGIEGRKIFSGGLDISDRGSIKDRALIENTQKALGTSEQIFYEAAFESQNGLFNCIVDILVRCERSISVIEVKSSTKIKVPEHIYDVGIQYRVLRHHPEFKKMRFFIAYLNPQYILGKQIDYEQLFILEDVTQRAADIQSLIDRNLQIFPNVIDKNTAPQVSVGKQCTKPYQCSFYNYCWQNVPDSSLAFTSLSSKTRTKLEALGIKDIADIPRDTKLSESQWLEIDSKTEKAAKINKPKILNFISTLKLEEEIFYMDFESMMPAIPIYEGTKCYQQICFQYCVLYRKTPASSLSRKEFLAEPGDDPRKAFLENLIRDTTGTGKVIVYNKTFEVTRLRELAIAFPMYASKIEDLILRIVDLMKPFAGRHYYHPSFKKGYSIKVVLPVLCPEMELAYKVLPINNGSIAMNKYELMSTMSAPDRISTKLALKEYCYTDVIAMVKVVEKLREITI